MAAIEQALIIGEDPDHPVIAFHNCDFLMGGVVCTRSIDFVGEELAIDDLRATMKAMESFIGAGFITVYGKALHDSAGDAFLVQTGAPKNQIISGYVDFRTVNGETVMTPTEFDDYPFRVPEYTNLVDILEPILYGVPYKTPVWYTAGNDTQKFYFKNCTRLSKYNFELYAVSGIGPLDRPTHYGGLYNGESLRSVIDDIMRTGGSRIVPYDVDPAIADIPVFGWLPVQSARDNLRDLIRAYGFIIRRTIHKDIYFTLPPRVSQKLERERVFYGGSVDYRQDKKYAFIEVTEHNFLKTDTDQAVTLYDNTADELGVTANQEIITFSDAPCYDFKFSGGLSGTAYPNYAVISGVGKLTGKKYTHTERLFRVRGDSSADPDSVRKRDDCYVINAINSFGAAMRLKNYYCEGKEIRMDFISSGEQPGDTVEFTDPYGQPAVGILTAMTSKATSFVRAQSKIIMGYDPQYWGNTYNYFRLLTGAGIWTVPDDMDGQIIRVVLIGGGQGGASGIHGGDYQQIPELNAERYINGGGAGDAGTGGRIYVDEIMVHGGEKYIFWCGDGGKGGFPDTHILYENTAAANPPESRDDDDEIADPGDSGVDWDKISFRYRGNRGETGGATTFGKLSGALSSQAGFPRVSGFRNFLGDASRFARSGNNGSAGGLSGPEKGKNQKEDDAEDRVLPDGVKYGNTTWAPGAYGGNGWALIAGIDSDFYAYLYGGSGGGAAVGGNGGPGSAAKSGQYSAVAGGDGGNGADARPIFQTDKTYGSGGDGGHGGGEAGKGGKGNPGKGGSDRFLYQGKNGQGGSGSAGQDGEDGCILLYTPKQTNTDEFILIPPATVTGNPAVFHDGAENIPVKDLSVELAPVQSGSGDPSPENIRPISGVDSVTVARSGKNLFRMPAQAVRQSALTALDDGTYLIEGSGDGSYYSDMFTLPKGTYRLDCRTLERTGTFIICRVRQVNPATGNNVAIQGQVNENGDSVFTLNEDTAVKCELTIPNDNTASFRLVVQCMLSYGSGVVPFEKFSGYQTVTISTGEAGTVYGGTLDVTTGVLTVTHVMVNLPFPMQDSGGKNMNRLQIGWHESLFRTIEKPTKTYTNANLMTMCSHWPTASAVDQMNGTANNTIAMFRTSDGGVFVSFQIDSMANVSALKAYLNEQAEAGTPVQIVYPILTPKTYQLTPAEITTLLGENIIRSGAGSVSVTYRADPALALA